MKKTFKLFAGALVLSFAIAACNSKPAEQPATETPVETETPATVDSTAAADTTQTVSADTTAAQ
ncbi:MAG TPA: hypothetical protein VD927_10540 [Chryseosolibacter sp.]|nr:hypothetical protein [Chryseosolibacter sp.]